MMTKQQCSDTLAMFSARLELDQHELATLKETYRSMFNADWDEEQQSPLRNLDADRARGRRED